MLFIKRLLKRKLSDWSSLANDWAWPLKSLGDLPGAPFFTEVAPMPSQCSDLAKEQVFQGVNNLQPFGQLDEIPCMTEESQSNQDCLSITMSHVLVEVLVSKKQAEFYRCNQKEKKDISGKISVDQKEVKNLYKGSVHNDEIDNTDKKADNIDKKDNSCQSADENERNDLPPEVSISFNKREAKFPKTIEAIFNLGVHVNKIENEHKDSTSCEEVDHRVENSADEVDSDSPQTLPFRTNWTLGL